MNGGYYDPATGNTVPNPKTVWVLVGTLLVICGGCVGMAILGSIQF
jgi:hypothetical protein